MKYTKFYLAEGMTFSHTHFFSYPYFLFLSELSCISVIAFNLIDHTCVPGCLNYSYQSYAIEKCEQGDNHIYMFIPCLAISHSRVLLYIIVHNMVNSPLVRRVLLVCICILG